MLPEYTVSSKNIILLKLHDDFIEFIETLKPYNRDIDVMLECKGKDEALFRLVRLLKYHNYNFIDETTINLK